MYKHYRTLGIQTKCRVDLDVFAQPRHFNSSGLEGACKGFSQTIHFTIFVLGQNVNTHTRHISNLDLALKIVRDKD